MPTVKLSVRGLTAGNEADLERALRAIEGVFGAVASRAGGCCEIDFEDDVEKASPTSPKIRKRVPTACCAPNTTLAS